MGSLSGMAHAGSPLSTSSMEEEEPKGMGGICLGRVKARKSLSPPPFSLCFMKLMNYNIASEYSLPTPDSHSEHTKTLVSTMMILPFEY